MNDSGGGKRKTGNALFAAKSIITKNCSSLRHHLKTTFEASSISFLTCQHDRYIKYAKAKRRSENENYTYGSCDFKCPLQVSNLLKGWTELYSLQTDVDQALHAAKKVIAPIIDRLNQKELDARDAQAIELFTKLSISILNLILDTLYNDARDPRTKRMLLTLAIMKSQNSLLSTLGPKGLPLAWHAFVGSFNEHSGPDYSLFLTIDETDETIIQLKDELVLKEALDGTNTIIDADNDMRDSSLSTPIIELVRSMLKRVLYTPFVEYVEQDKFNKTESKLKRAQAIDGTRRATELATGAASREEPTPAPLMDTLITQKAREVAIKTVDARLKERHDQMIADGLIVAPPQAPKNPTKAGRSQDTLPKTKTNKPPGKTPNKPKPKPLPTTNKKRQRPAPADESNNASPDGNRVTKRSATSGRGRGGSRLKNKGRGH
jgi:hypothetical protein